MMSNFILPRVPSVSFLIQKLSFEEVLRVRDSVENACYVANLPLHLKQIFQMTRYGSWYLPVITLYNNISVDGWTCKLSVTLKLRRTHQLGQYTQDDWWQWQDPRFIPRTHQWPMTTLEIAQFSNTAYLWWIYTSKDPTTSYLIDFVNILLSNCFLVILGDEAASTTSTAWVEGHQLRLLHTNILHWWTKSSEEPWIYIPWCPSAPCCRRDLEHR